MSPLSTVPFQNHLFVRNSSQSDNSSKKELDFVRDLGHDESASNASEHHPILENSIINKDTFLMFFVPFWNLMRKEDAIVERLVWVCCSRDFKNPTINFESFQLFYKIFIFQERYTQTTTNHSSSKMKINFVLDFLMFKNENEVSFMEVQGIIMLLC